LRSIKTLNEPQLSTVFDDVKRDTLKSINCVNVGRIEAFDASEQTATVRILIKRVQEEKDDGTRVLQERPLLLRCPVVIMQGGPTVLTFPIQEGDECLVLFNDREIDNWWISGDASAPDTDRFHDASDAFALVGLFSLPKRIQDYLTDGIRLAHEVAKMEIKSDSIDTVASNFTHTGDMTVDGDLTVTGDLTVSGRITCNNATIAGIDFASHIHTGDSGGNTSGPK